MKIILNEPLPWDSNHIYQIDNLVFFMEYKDHETYIKIPPKLSLHNILSSLKYIFSFFLTF